MTAVLSLIVILPAVPAPAVVKVNVPEFAVRTVPPIPIPPADAVNVNAPPVVIVPPPPSILLVVAVKVVAPVVVKPAVAEPPVTVTVPIEIPVASV